MIRSKKIQAAVARRKWAKFSFFPSLLLSGKWLREAGFEIGQDVSIEVREGQILITAPGLLPTWEQLERQNAIQEDE